MGWLYHINRTNTARFALGTEGHFPLIFLGLNPSTAEPMNLDQTLKSVERIAEFHDFQTWVAINLYPQRATHPNDLHSSCDQALHRTNLKHIENILIFGEPVIWAAWGTKITIRPYLQDSIRDIFELSKKYNCLWVTIGDLSKDGHPHHPLYLKKDAEMKEFDIEKYLHGFNNLSRLPLVNTHQKLY
jgi:hypothetical protein